MRLNSNIGEKITACQVASLMLQTQAPWEHWISDVGFRVQGFGLQVWSLGLAAWALGLGFKRGRGFPDVGGLCDLGLRSGVLGFGFRSWDRF